MRKILISLALLGTLALSAQTIATVNGKKITDKDVYEMLMQATRGQYQSLPEDKKREMEQRAIQGIIAEQLIYDEAKKSGVLKSKLYKKQVKKSRKAAKEQFEKSMKRMERQVAAKVWEKNLYDSVKISDKDVKAYYDANKAEFENKIELKASHILVKTKSKAEKIITKLKSKKGAALAKAFASEAKKSSTGPSKTKGGDLGYFAKGMMLPEFYEASIALTKGHMTMAPVKTEYGYHVILLTDKKKAKTVSYEEAKKAIEYKLHNEEFRDLITQKQKKLQKNVKIEKPKK